MNDEELEIINRIYNRLFATHKLGIDPQSPETSTHVAFSIFNFLIQLQLVKADLEMLIEKTEVVHDRHS